MATLVRPSQNNTYYINPNSLTFVENSGYGVNFIQVSASSSCYITVYDPENGVTYNVDSGYRKWKVTAYNNKFPNDKPEYLDAWNIYVRLERSGTSALVIYDQKDRAFSGGIITKDEDGSSIIGDADQSYYYIKLGVVGKTDGVSVIRSIIYDTGNLNTPASQNAAWDMLNAMFVPHYEDLNNPEKLTWIEAKSHMGIQGGVSSFLEGEDLDLPSIYDGLPIDNQTLFWEETDGVRVLKSKGSGSGEGSFGKIETVDNGGNAITKVEVVKGDEENPDKLVFFKNLTFVEKSYVDNNFYNKTYSDNNFAKASELKSLQTSFNDFLTGTDSDNIVNKWKELEAFLSNMTESDNLASILSNKAEKTALESLSKVVETKWTKDDTKILNWDTAFGWGDHSKAGYALKTYVDETFIGIKGDYTIEGTKNFVGSLQVNGCPIVYDAQKKYWKLEGDLLVTGGLSTFSSDLEFDPSTIMDGINCDGVTIHVNEYGQLEVIGGTGGEVDEDAVKEIIESYGFATSAELPKFNTSDFSVSGGIVSLKGASVKIVSSSDSMSETDVLYVIV